MKTRLAFIFLALALAGCTHTSYTDPRTGAKFSRTSLLASQSLNDVAVKSGDTSVRIGSASNEPAALVEAAVRAAIAGAK